MRRLYALGLSLLFSLQVSAAVEFRDVTAETGITFHHVDGRSGEKFLIETLGSGALFFDFDADGWLDLYVVNATDIPSPRNAKKGEKSGDTPAQPPSPRNMLYKNNGDGTFTDITESAGVGDTGYGVGCTSADVDNDGYPDIYVTNYGENRLYKNNGDGTFTDITERAGIAHRALGLAVAVGDYNNDGYPDLHIANDMEADLFYRNNRDGTFTEIADFTGTGYDENGFPGSGMGNAFGDYNNDGYLDIVVSNASGLPAILYENEKAEFFTDVSFLSGIGAVTLPYFKWAVEFFDYDNDGLLDIFVANGHLQENISLFSEDTYPQMDLVFRNSRSGDGGHRFTDVSAAVGLAALPKKVSRAAAFGDYDGDGDLDIFLNNSNQPATLLRNEGGDRNRWLIVKVIGSGSNRSGIGTKVRLKAGELTLFREVRSGASYLSQSDLRVHFGLGTHSEVETLEVQWSNGQTERFSALKTNRTLVIKEGQGIITRNGVR